MGINFNDRVLVTNPTTYYLGRGVLAAGIIAIIVGGITHFTGDLILPSSAWCAFGVPPLFIGWVLMRSGLTKN